MHVTPLNLVAYLFGLMAACGVGYLALSLYGAWKFLHAPRPVPGSHTPPVSILKPLCGTDREMYEGFRSHCLQQYPAFELIFGVASADDPAVADVERLRGEFPECKIQLVLCPKPLGPNRKASSLVQMLAAANYEHILVNDSDIRVEQDYLARVMARFADPQVGMVTTLYRAHAGDTIASRIEAVTVGTDFAGGVLSALALEGGMHFGLGSTLALRKDVLQKIGGFEALVDCLADDYELGHRTAQAGYRVELSETVVDTFLPSYGMAGMLQHQLRWARTMRDMRRGGYFGVLFTFALPWAVVAALCARGAAWSLALLAFVAIARFATAVVLCGPVLHDRRTMRDMWLVPVRDFLGVLIWAWAHAGDTITWRGEVFHLKDGKLKRV